MVFCSHFFESSVVVEPPPGRQSGAASVIFFSFSGVHFLQSSGTANTGQPDCGASEVDCGVDAAATGAASTLSKASAIALAWKSPTVTVPCSSTAVCSTSALSGSAGSASRFHASKVWLPLNAIVTAVISPPRVTSVTGPKPLPFQLAV